MNCPKCKNEIDIELFAQQLKFKRVIDDFYTLTNDQQIRILAILLQWFFRRCDIQKVEIDSIGVFLHELSEL